MATARPGRWRCCAIQVAHSICLASMGADCTQEGNPWTLTAQLKHTGVIAAMVIDHFCAGTLEGGLTVLDLFSGGVGTAHVGSVGNWLNEDVLIDDVFATCHDAAGRILTVNSRDRRMRHNQQGSHKSEDCPETNDSRQSICLLDHVDSISPTSRAGTSRSQPRPGRASPWSRRWRCRATRGYPGRPRRPRGRRAP